MNLQGFRVEPRFGCKPNLPGLGLRRLLFLKLTVMVRLETAPTGLGLRRLFLLRLTVMVRLGNRTYRAWARGCVFSKIDSYGAVRNRTYLDAGTAAHLQ